MREMTRDEIAECLAGSHQAVLSLSRDERGPIAIPMSYLYRDGRFWMITSPETDHGRLMSRNRRASITIHYDVVSGRRVEQWYVTAEGPVEFTNEDPEPFLRAIMEKDRGPALADEWTAHSLPAATIVAVLNPEKLTGYLGVSTLP